MFLLDDILLAPVKGLAAVCRKVEEAARQDLENQGKAAMTALGELHRRLETGQIEEQDFDVEETRLLEQIERFRRCCTPRRPFSSRRHGSPLRIVMENEISARGRRRKHAGRACWTGC